MTALPNLAVATEIAARWLAADLAPDTVEPVAHAAAVYARTGDGRAVLVDCCGRVLLAGAAVPFSRHLADFRAGWRSDFVARPA